MDKIKEEVETARAQVEAAKKYYESVSASNDPFVIQMAREGWESAMGVLKAAEKSLATAYETRVDNLPPRHPQPIDESRVREIVASHLRWEPTRARRDMSVNSMSDAWNLMMSEQRIELGQAFFFPLKKLPNGFSTTAFQVEAYTDKDDENRLHHRYFLKHVGLLVEDATKYGVTIRQQLLWTFKGKWLTLDDSPANGKEPDFSNDAAPRGHSIRNLRQGGRSNATVLQVPSFGRV